MNGIDISGWQRGIDLTAVPCDFVISKATQGRGYTSPDFVRQINQAIGLGKKIGVYHYIDGSGAIAEMDHFIDSVSSWIGRAMLVLDWESEQNSAWRNEAYLEQCAIRVIERTGVPPVIYSSAAFFPWDICRKHNCGTWVAQYADNKPTGYQDSPWNEGKYTCAIRQYSSTGRLPGYNGNLDLDKFYGDGTAWDRYANPNDSQAPAPTPTPAPEGTTLELVDRVMRGIYGDGTERREALGPRYNEVQDFINHVASASVDTLAAETRAGKYGNGEIRKRVLGARYVAVQSAVNTAIARMYTVQRGDTLSSIAARFGVDVYDLARRNGINNPNLIYPGQRIRY